VGAVIVGLLPEMLASLEEYRLLFFGGLLLVVLWAAPGGVVGMLQRLLAGGRGRLARPSAMAIPAPMEATPARPFGGNSARPLHVKDLSMTFGGVRAVRDLTFDVPPATVTGLIGPNGAGKTTALNMLSGFYRPTSGTVTLGDEALQGRAAYRVARNGVARTYQTSQLFGSLGVVDNVALAMGRGQLGGLFAAKNFHSATVRMRSEELLAFCGYRGPLDGRAGDLPHVDRRLVEIARALATRPAVLLLDEPAAGLSQEDKAHLATLLRRIADNGIGVVLVEHDMGLVMQVCDRLVVLDAGQRLAVGTPEAIRADPAVRLAYLGEATSSLGVRATGTTGVAAESPELLGVGRLTTGYGAEPVLRDIDLQVRRGELVALLGANGAGKSTLMRALAGLQRPVRGGITFAGRDLVNLSTERIVALGLVLVPEGRQVFPELSVQDNLRLGAFLRPEDRETRIDAILARFPRLRERLHQRAGLLSGGEQQMLAIGRGLMSQPTILLLDEPSLGLAPLVIRELFTALDQLRAEDMTILLVDQMAALALALADRAYVIESGRIVGSGPADEIAHTPALAKAYLGT
jgi:ABC-type branched-subunit amino acid transport system ATPase component